MPTTATIAPAPETPWLAESDIGFLGRQPILDRIGRLAAYELLFRSNSLAAGKSVTDSHATATVIKRAFAEFGIQSVLGQHTGFINFGRELLSDDVVEMLPHDRIVLELLETIDVDVALVERVQALGKRGFRIALDDYVGVKSRYATLLPHVDIIKVDITGLATNRLESIARDLLPYGKQLLAEKVETREQANICRELGYSLFQGYYFAKPALISGRRISPADHAILKLSSLLIAGADSFAIERVFRENPDLSILLLRIVNSAAAGLSQRVTSLRHALLVVGMRHLSRWVQLLMYAMADESEAGFPSPLTIVAATRAKLMESIAATAYPDVAGLPERAFMTGMFSLAGILFGRPLEEVILPLPLSDHSKEALITRSGILGRLLTLAEVLESGNEQSVTRALEAIPRLTPSACSEIYRQAMLWADSLARPH